MLFPPLAIKLDSWRQIDPGMDCLLPDGICRRWKLRIGKSAYSNAVVIRPEVGLPIDRSAAILAEVKPQLASAFSRADIQLALTFKAGPETFCNKHLSASPLLSGADMRCNGKHSQYLVLHPQLRGVSRIGIARFAA